jgi:hypothetical protein
LGVGLSGCGGPIAPTPSTGPITIGGATVTVAIAGAALGSDCPAASTKSGLCATGDGGVCSDLCQQSTLQLKVTATGSGSAALQVLAVRIVDPQSGQTLQALTAREPQIWSGSAYAAWDQTVTAPADLTASYKLSAPDWAQIGTYRAAQTSYRVEADVVVGSERRLVSIDGVTREPPINT